MPEGYGDKDLADIFDALDLEPRLMGAPVWLMELPQWVAEAGCRFIEYAGWETRARGSGGFPALPLCVIWHHTASPASWDGKKDADYIATGDDDAPLANLYIQRDGCIWILAAGATNTNGKGQALPFSRGTVPQDSMNTHAVGIEMGNDGIGEPWPTAQIDAAFAVSNVINAHLGNIPYDLSTHNEYAPDRKIDPARAESVQGPWRPQSVNGSGSWSAASVRSEAALRATYKPLPPDLEDGDGMARQLVRSGTETHWNAYICFGGGKYWLASNEAIGQAVKDFGYDPIAVDAAWMMAAGPVVGPNPTGDAWGVWDT